jgi:hypothetical protein
MKLPRVPLRAYALPGAPIDRLPGLVELAAHVKMRKTRSVIPNRFKLEQANEPLGNLITSKK